MSSLIWVLTVLILALAGNFAGAAECKVDFARKLRPWDGFGANYVETRHTRDHKVFPQDYGGFKYLNDAQREKVIDLVFGADGLRPSIVKSFVDSFHEPVNDNDDPYAMDMSKFDHTTTARQVVYFGKRGLAKTRSWGGNLTFLAGLYGPPGWMTKQKVLRGRDLAPGMMPELAEYLASWVKYLRDIERLPVKYASPYNEGEDKKRWPADGGDPQSHWAHDYNMWWPDTQVVDFLKTARKVFDKHGLKEVGLTSGEPSSWLRFFTFTTPDNEHMEYARRIKEDPEALKNLALMTSHDFQKKYDSRGIDLLRQARPELRAWTTSDTWGDMSLSILEEARQLIYTVKVNALIPWATVHHDEESDKLSPPAGKRVSSNANSPIKTDNSEIEVTKAYYHYKQVSRAGQAGMAVAEVVSEDPDIGLIAFSSNGTSNPDALIVLNLAKTGKKMGVSVAGTSRKPGAAWITTDPDFGNRNYAPLRGYGFEARRLTYDAPPRSAATFYFGAIR